jgi:hypothetical protein
MGEPHAGERRDMDGSAGRSEAGIAMSVACVPSISYDNKGSLRSSCREIRASQKSDAA